MHYYSIYDIIGIAYLIRDGIFFLPCSETYFVFPASKKSAGSPVRSKSRSSSRGRVASSAKTTPRRSRRSVVTSSTTTTSSSSDDNQTVIKKVP